jgi:putative protease
MKTAYYVATVVSAYRRALDLLELQGEEDYRQSLPTLMEELQKASHRTSNTGFYFGAPEPPAGANGFSQTMEYVGDFLSDAQPGEDALVRLKNRFYVGDTLEALTPSGSHSFTVDRMTLTETGENVQTASVAGTLLRIPVPFAVGTGDLLRGPNRNHR